MIERERVIERMIERVRESERVIERETISTTSYNQKHCKCRDYHSHRIHIPHTCSSHTLFASVICQKVRE